MGAWILALPLAVILLGVAGLTMLVPVGFALATGDGAVAQDFFAGFVAVLILFVMLAIATQGVQARRRGRSLLISLISAYALLPIVLALPLTENVEGTDFFDAWIEMVSAFTTTGATLFAPEELPPSLHLWRALIGWLGGLFVWVTAIAVLAPLNLGGFEVTSSRTIGQGAVGAGQMARVADPTERLLRYLRQFLPIYLGLTAILMLGLILVGEAPLVALCHSMSILSTSGISPVDGLSGGAAGVPGEVLMALFLVFALSSLTFSIDERSGGTRTLARDPELRLGLGIVGILPFALFLRHWLPAPQGVGGDFVDGITGLWGGAFTGLSFLTTTGFVSSFWDEALEWSGLGTSGLLLMGLAVFGGGVATTAGGVKLLRVYALYKHGVREMDKLVLPSSVGGAGTSARRIRREGAYAAWVFFMLFALSIGAAMLAFSLSGVEFETSVVLAISGLSTTGPLTEVAMAEPIDLRALPRPAKLVFAITMVVGRMETLAIVALLNPAFWRR